MRSSNPRASPILTAVESETLRQLPVSPQTMQTILKLVLLFGISAYALPLEKEKDVDPFDALYDPFSVGFSTYDNYDWIFQTIEKLEEEMEAKKISKESDETVLNNVPNLFVPRPFAAFHPFVGQRLKHLEAEVLRHIEQDELEKESEAKKLAEELEAQKMAEELEAKKIAEELKAKATAEETKKAKAEVNPWNIFNSLTPMNFKMIG